MYWSAVSQVQVKKMMVFRCTWPTNEWYMKVGSDWGSSAIYDKGQRRCQALVRWFICKSGGKCTLCARLPSCPFLSVLQLVNAVYHSNTEDISRFNGKVQLMISIPERLMSGWWKLNRGSNNLPIWSFNNKVIVIPPSLSTPVVLAVVVLQLALGLLGTWKGTEL